MYLTTILNEVNQNQKEYIRIIYWKRPTFPSVLCHKSTVFICIGLFGGFLVYSVGPFVHLVPMPFCSICHHSTVLWPRRASLVLFFRTGLSTSTKKPNQTNKQTCPVGSLMGNTLICRSVWREWTSLHCWSFSPWVWYNLHLVKFSLRALSNVL